MKQFRDLNDLLCLTDKEIEENFSDKFHVGDYVLSSKYNLYKIQFRTFNEYLVVSPCKKINTSNNNFLIKDTYLIPINKESIKTAYQKSRNIFSLFKKFFINEVTKLLGVDNVDYQENHSYVTLYFPELTVTNDVGMSHKIRGIYFSFYLRETNNKNKLRLVGFDLKRDTFTYVELFHKYSFSHQSDLIGGSLCLGSTDLSEEFHFNETSKKIASIISYLSSENTVGAYANKQIHKLTNYTLEPVILDTSLEFLDLINYAFNYLVNFDVDNDLNIDNVVFSKPLKEIVDEAYSKKIINKEQYNQTVVHSLGDKSGSLVTMNKEKLYKRYHDLNLITFKNEIKKLKIVEEPEDDKLPEDLRIGINSEFIFFLNATLERKFKDFYDKKIEEHAKQYYSI